LCEQALGLLQSLQQTHQSTHSPVTTGQQVTASMEIEEVEISDSDELMDKYGIRIPVVVVSGREAELGWPFSLPELSRFLFADR
jgi:hypothetical protein